MPRRTKIFEEEEEKEEGFSKIKGKLTPNSLYFSPPSFIYLFIYLFIIYYFYYYFYLLFYLFIIYYSYF